MLGSPTCLRLEISGLFWDRAIHSPNRQWLIQIESGESNSGECRQNRPFWRLIINHKVAINFGKLLILYLKKSKIFVLCIWLIDLTFG